MKRYAPFLWALILSAVVIGLGFVGREIRDQSYPRRIYFVEGHGLYYILAREYREHTVVGDKIFLRTDKGVIELENKLEGREGVTWRSNGRAIEKIEELKSEGIIPKEPQ